MINQINYIISDQVNPYHNLALEEYLLTTVKKGTCILYLWQNQHTVVIGKNQNSWKECKVKELEEDGGYLVRRLSGGGAVFHDLGNLNFTFLLHKEDYNVDRQLEVILVALQQLGIKAEKSGRNDITIDGKKFSGNAYYELGGRCYHHGTLLVQVDMMNLSKYLNVSKDKLVSKGVDSVKARVTNLVNYHEGLTIGQMKEELLIAFSKVYGLEAQKTQGLDYSNSELDELYKKFSSWEWRFGKKIEFQHSISNRFTWGDIDLHLIVNGGKVIEAKVFSDAMEVDLIEQLPPCFMGCPYEPAQMAHSIEQLKEGKDANIVVMIDDIRNLLLKEI